jgi:predicted small secreted protein
MFTNKNAALFSATALVSTLLAGCIQTEQGLVIDQTAQLLSSADFREYYCDDSHKASYCGVEQTGHTVIKNRSKDIWIYVNSVEGGVQLELAEKRGAQWVTTHQEIADDPGFVERAYNFDTVALRRARVIKANGDIYHVSILAD